MKVTAPQDLDGRLCLVESRLRMVQESLAALASAYVDVGAPSEAALAAFGYTIEEIADEVAAIHSAQIDEANAEYLAAHPELAQFFRTDEAGEREH